MKECYFRLMRYLWLLIDAVSRKHENMWSFSTHPVRTGEFTESPLAVFDHIKSDYKIRKIIFYRGVLVEQQITDAVNYEFVELGTWRSLFLLARSKVVFITNSISMEFSLRWGKCSFCVLPISSRHRVIVNLSHGVSIKRLMYVSSQVMQKDHDRNPYREKERRNYTGLLAASDSDGYVMAAMYYPLNHHQIWVTGSPRNDFLVMEETRLPAYISQSIAKIRDVVQGRRLVLYAPTYRQMNVSSSAHYYQFADEEIARLRTALKAHNAVLGYRPHYFKNSSDYFNMGQYVDGDSILDMSQTVVPDISALIRECALVVTDYSSVYTEALYLNKPGLCFAYDLDEYNQSQDGLLYDPNLIFSNRVFKNFDSLLAGLESCLQQTEHSEGDANLTRSLFFKFSDDRNAERVCERVKRALDQLAE